MSLKLFSDYKLGNITLKNRVVMAPMTRSRAVNNNAPNDLMVKYYQQRAGAGLIITEGVSPSPNGLGYPRIPGAFTQEQFDGWKNIAKAVHSEGSAIFMQIMHTGRVGHDLNLPEQAEVLSPTDVTLSGEMYTDKEGPKSHTKPKRMTKAHIDEAIEEYVSTAKNIVAAGFDGVEIHAANGYLIEQFINANVNDRDDEYGGSIENRSRFLIEVAQKIVAEIGADKVGVRISPYGVFNDTGNFDGVEETFVYIAQKMSELGLAYIHVVDHSAMGAPEVPDSIKQKIRNAFEGTYILSGGYDKQRAEQDLEDGKGDLVAFGRPFISNPDLVERMEKDAPLADPDPDTFYTADEKGYTDYPFLEEAKA